MFGIPHAFTVFYGLMTDSTSQWIEAMRAERYDVAWAMAERTLAERDPATRDDPSLPYHRRWVWDGRGFDDRHVLVRCYNGLGDTIQFARYLPYLAQRASAVTLEAQPSLVPLLAQIEGVDTVVPFDPAHPLPPAECDIEITELAFALRMAPDGALPGYLTAARAVVPSGTIALCHGSGDWDADRDIPAELFEPLCALAPCITLVAAPCSLSVLNPDGCPMDMEITAALVASADLVVTVDTMIAHLAGALCRQTWLLLKAEPDWRWNPAARSSPWYPTMRLFAQPAPGDWNGVIAEVERELAIRLGGIRGE